VVDGDTIEIRAARIRLHGIDAPESGQTCTDSAGSRPVTCTRRDTDRYGRMVAVCVLSDDTDIGPVLVQQGLALAFRRYSLDYVADEEVAHAARYGMWSGTFVVPSEWRRGAR
jgi:endonuclease YncB( thermonuclease family)